MVLIRSASGVGVGLPSCMWKGGAHSGVCSGSCQSNFRKV